jgi:hypothetical protein
MWWVAPAFAEEPAPDDEIVVEGRIGVDEARAALDEALRRDGYVIGVPIGRGRTVWFNRERWKGRMVVSDDGLIEPHVGWLVPLVVVPAAHRIVVSGLVGSPRQARQTEDRMLAAIEPFAGTLRDAIGEDALQRRLEEVGREVDAIWHGPAAPADRRAAIVARWLATADNDAGARVRARIRRYVRDVVQADAPFTPAELDAANARRTFPDELL